MASSPFCRVIAARDAGWRLLDAFAVTPAMTRFDRRERVPWERARSLLLPRGGETERNTSDCVSELLNGDRAAGHESDATRRGDQLVFRLGYSAAVTGSVDRNAVEIRLVINSLSHSKSTIETHLSELLAWAFQQGSNDMSTLTIECPSTYTIATFFISSVPPGLMEAAIRAIPSQLEPQMDAHVFWEGRWRSDV